MQKRIHIRKSVCIEKSLEGYQLSRLFYYVTKDGVVLSKRVQIFMALLQELYEPVK